MNYKNLAVLINQQRDCEEVTDRESETIHENDLKVKRLDREVEFLVGLSDDKLQ